MAAALLQGSMSFAQPSSVKIGIISPVTGPVALDGDSFRKGAMIAVKEVNDAGGVLARKLELLIEDGECKPTTSASAAQKLIVRDNVSVIVGAHCSPSTAAVIPISDREKIPFVTGISSAPSLTQTPHRWFFRLPPTEDLTARAAVPYYLERLGLKSVAIFAQNDEWGRQAAQENAKLLKERGVNVHSVDYFLPGESEFSASLSTVKASNPDALFVAAATREAILIAKKVNELRMRQKLLGVGAWPTNTFITRAESAGMGWLAISQYVPTIDTPRNKAFVAAYQQAYGELPDKYGVSGHDAILVVADALKRAGAEDRAKIRDALEQTNMEVVQGTVRFDVHHQAYTNAVISENKDGKSLVVKVIPTAPN